MRSQRGACRNRSPVKNASGRLRKGDRGRNALAFAERLQTPSPCDHKSIEILPAPLGRHQADLLEVMEQHTIAFRPCSESSGVSDEKLDNISRPFQDSQVESVECIGCLMKIRRDGLVVKPDQRQHHIPLS